MERQRLHLRVRYGLAGRVLSRIQFGLDAQAGGGARTAYQVDNGLKGTQRLAAPVLRDVTEQAVLNLVPLAGARPTAARPALTPAIAGAP